jgi:hypothetical protein
MDSDERTEYLLARILPKLNRLMADTGDIQRRLSHIEGTTKTIWNLLRDYDDERCNKCDGQGSPFCDCE